MEKIVIYGGSFDPVHNGHLRLARAASLRLNAEVVFVPAKSPRWKEPSASPDDRLAMLKLALEENGSADFSIDLFEINSDSEVNYSIDTIHHFQDKYPNHQLYLLIGADQANQFDKWQNPAEIASCAQVVYVERPDVKIDKAIADRFHMIPLNYGGSGSVSSTSVRELKSIDVPSKVLDYIESHRLYYMEKLTKFVSGKRLVHSLSVAHLAYAIAKRNDILNPEHAYIAGLLHDLGKHLDAASTKKIMEENFSEYTGYPDWCFHQFTGCYLAKKEFGVQEEDILDAIKYHCTGKAHMPPLTKIIYESDKIEPSRGYDSSKMIARCLKNYYIGFIYVLKENTKYLKKAGMTEDNPLSEECRRLYLGEKKK